MAMPMAIANKMANQGRTQRTAPGARVGFSKGWTLGPTPRFEFRSQRLPVRPVLGLLGARFGVERFAQRFNLTAHGQPEQRPALALRAGLRGEALHQLSAKGL